MTSLEAATLIYHTNGRSLVLIIIVVHLSFHVFFHLLLSLGKFLIQIVMRFSDKLLCNCFYFLLNQFIYKKKFEFSISNPLTTQVEIDIWSSSRIIRLIE